MLIVVTTGHSHSGWEDVLPTLQCAGLEPASGEFTQWHDDLFRTLGVDKPLRLGSSLQPTPELTERAERLCAHIPDSSLLLFSDSRSLWVLDFWAKLLPQARFLLFYKSARSALASALTHGLEPTEYLDAWQTANKQLVQFQRRQRKRTLLIDAEAAVRSPVALLDACLSIGLVLQPAQQWPEVGVSHSSLERFIAAQFVSRTPSIQSLQLELEASAYPLGDVVVFEEVNADEIYDSYRRRVHAHDEMNLVLRAAEQQQQRLSKDISDLKERLEEARHSVLTIDEARKNVSEESELLSLQLHQVQEQLEVTFLVKQQNEARAKEQDAQYEALQNIFEGLQKDSAELKLQLAHVDSERGQVQEEVAKVRAERDRFQAECDKLQADAKGVLMERDKLSSELKSALASTEQVSKNLISEKSELQDPLGKALQSHDELQESVAAEKRELTAKFDTLCAAQQTAEAARKGAAEENELLLLQLHQVQEELEYYFTKCQELEMPGRTTDVVLRERHPEFCTTTSLTVLGGEQKAPFRNLNCMLEGVQQGERNWGKVNIKLLDTKGQPGLEFRQGSKDIASPLIRWVESGKDQSGAYMVIRPDAPDAMDIFSRMPTSDWLLINGLAELMAYQLRTGQFNRGKKAETLAIGPWCATARTLRQQLRSLAPALRFDSVKLREANVSAGYEHLWLDFTNAQFGGRLYPEFNFKLAAKEIKGEAFTQRATLVFRELDKNLAPLESWPPENVDKFGPLLQLEFSTDLTDGQKADWAALTDEDRAFVAGLVARLPAVLTQLEADGCELKRSWLQWQQLLLVMLPNNDELSPPAAPVGQVFASTNEVSSPEDNNTVTTAPFQFAEVNLGEVNIRPDYEHLRVDFKNLRWQTDSFQDYSFKLAATDVRDGKFTGRMSLTFRELAKGKAPLECWPHAVKDQYGSVVRLAFGGVLTDEQQGDWARLTDKDQAFVNALMDSLLDVLQRLQKKNNAKRVKRDWADWRQLIRQQIGADTSAV